jgi:hypothetical protein
MLKHALKPKGCARTILILINLKTALMTLIISTETVKIYLKKNLLPGIKLMARNFQIKVLDYLKTTIYQKHYIMQYLTLNFGLQPMGFAREAWNVLKLMSAYAARKKLEISGAMAFSSPAT